MPVKKQKTKNAVLTKQNMSAHWASGHPFMSSALMRSICAALCVEPWFPLLTLLYKSCFALNKLLNFHFRLFYIKAIGPWASCLLVFRPQFVIYTRSTGSAVSKGPQHLWSWHSLYVITLVPSLCPSPLCPFGQWAKDCRGSKGFLKRSSYKVV